MDALLQITHRIKSVRHCAQKNVSKLLLPRAAAFIFETRQYLFCTPKSTLMYRAFSFR